MGWARLLRRPGAVAEALPSRRVERRLTKSRPRSSTTPHGLACRAPPNRPLAKHRRRADLSDSNRDRETRPTLPVRWHTRARAAVLAPWTSLRPVKDRQERRDVARSAIRRCRSRSALPPVATPVSTPLTAHHHIGAVASAAAKTTTDSTNTTSRKM